MKNFKKFLQTMLFVVMVLSTSACIIPPYYDAGVSYSYSVAPQPYYWGYANQPVVFSTPYYGYGSVYDPYFGFAGLGNAIVQGISWGLGLGLVNMIFGGHHHH